MLAACDIFAIRLVSHSMVQILTSAMLSVSQSEKPLDQISFYNKNLSHSSLSTTSDYSSNPSHSLSSFSSTSKELLSSSDFANSIDSVIESFKLDTKRQPKLGVIKTYEFF